MFITLNEKEILSLMECSPKGEKLMKLYKGDTTDYRSPESAQVSLMCHLAYWCGKDIYFMDRLFRQSGLYSERYKILANRERLWYYAINHTNSVYKPQDSTSRDWLLPGVVMELTDTGNADLMKLYHPDDILFNKDSNKWLIWDEKHYKQDNTNQILLKAQEIIDQALYKLKFHKIESKLKDKVENFLLSSKNLSKLNNMIEVLKSKPGVTVEQNMLNRNKDLLCVKNGVINLRDAHLLPHDKKYLMTKIIDLDYDFRDTVYEDKRPVFTKFIDSISSQDQDLAFYHRVLCGYFLTGETREQSLFFYIGKGSTGKSTLANVLRNVMGPYCKDAPPGAFIEKNNNSNFELAYIADARLVISSEESERSKFDEPLIKRLSGSEELSCCHKYADYFRFKPEFKLLTTTNEVPYIASQGYDMKRRIKALPFIQRFTEGDPDFPLDRDLEEKLKKEAASILAWMVGGAVLYYSQGLYKCEAVDTTIEDIFDDQDYLGDWLDNYFERDATSYITLKELWESYTRYCANTEAKKNITHPKGLAKNLSKRDDIVKCRKTGGVGFKGLKKKDVIYTLDETEILSKSIG